LQTFFAVSRLKSSNSRIPARFIPNKNTNVKIICPRVRVLEASNLYNANTALLKNVMDTDVAPERVTNKFLYHKTMQLKVPSIETQTLFGTFVELFVGWRESGKAAIISFLRTNSKKERRKLLIQLGY
jgi:hypothetical protein